jgi:lipopolysaccharide transport system ATP-binding protein
MFEVLIKVEGVSKKFCKDLRRSLWYGMQDIASAIRGNDKDANELRKGEFWAVQDVNFEVRRGECLGLIGHNGAGKSTLLKMLNGLIRPDKGLIEMKGRVGALIELGAGFNPVLTGRENVYNNGAVLGFSKAEIDRKFDEIVAFAELEEFIDMPVQNYSSGMKVRLGFAVASQMEPDILLIDEVLAVGDMGFIIKCFNRMDELIRHTAVIFVSHSMPQISRIANNLILMDHGMVKHHGSVSEGIDTFYANFNFISSYHPNEDVKINEILLNGLDAVNIEKLPQVNRGEYLNFEFSLNVNPIHKRLEVYLVVYDKEQRGVAEFVHGGQKEIINNSDELRFNLFFPNIQFSKGVYSITLALKNLDINQTLIRAQSVAFFQVLSEESIWTAFELDGKLSQIN